MGEESEESEASEESEVDNWQQIERHQKRMS